MGKPGIILYFDFMEPIKTLDDADAGRLFRAILEYGKTGVSPEFDGMLALAWQFIRPKIDRDSEIYEEKKEQRKYAAFCKKRVLAGLSKVPFTLWQTMSEAERNRLLEVGEEQRAVDFVNEEQREQRAVDFVASRYPSKTKAKAETETETKAKSISEAEAKAEGADGAPVPIAAAVVFLSDDELEALRKQMGAEMLNHYVGKLATFIRKNGATVNDHCATILKWWREDGCKKAISGRVPNGASGRLGAAEMDNIRRLMQEEV